MTPVLALIASEKFPFLRVKKCDSSESADFRTTHWSVVLQAGQESSAVAAAALEELCRSYWYPLYAFVRRQGRTRPEAEDLTQEFFARLLRSNGLASVRPARGRFRSFLLASLKNFLANEWDRAHAAKRGGGREIISFEDQSGEHRYLCEPAHEASPEKLFEQTWALTVIGTVFEHVAREYSDTGRGELFSALQAYLSEEGGPDTYAGVAAKLKMTEAAVKMAVLRLRENFRRRLCAEIAHTVADPAEIEAELRHLFNCLGR